MSTVMIMVPLYKNYMVQGYALEFDKAVSITSKCSINVSGYYILNLIKQDVSQHFPKLVVSVKINLLLASPGSKIRERGHSGGWRGWKWEKRPFSPPAELLLPSGHGA